MSDDVRQRIAAICRERQGAEVSDPWGSGHDAWKVGRKTFRCIGAVAEGVSVKCADVDTAQMLKQGSAAQHLPYFYKSWVRLPKESDELRERIVASYELIRAKLPAVIRNGLRANTTED